MAPDDGTERPNEAAASGRPGIRATSHQGDLRVQVKPAGSFSSQENLDSRIRPLPVPVSAKRLSH